ncbi:MAG: HypC/HybG/HupF family hydrogenase formation chaperone [Caldiserica bacterium]|nr:HypC/HybG/HupF family hydrogenase formation chaperone [Caldisericota bacterium]
MCLGIPAKIVEKNGLDAVAEMVGVKRSIRLDMLPEAKVGEFVIIHTGFAIETVTEAEARTILETIEQAYGGIPA